MIKHRTVKELEDIMSEGFVFDMEGRLVSLSSDASIAPTALHLLGKEVMITNIQGKYYYSCNTYNIEETFLEPIPKIVYKIDCPMWMRSESSVRKKTVEKIIHRDIMSDICDMGEVMKEIDRIDGVDEDRIMHGEVKNLNPSSPGLTQEQEAHYNKYGWSDWSSPNDIFTVSRNGTYTLPKDCNYILEVPPGWRVHFASRDSYSIYKMHNPSKEPDFDTTKRIIIK